MDPSLDDCRFIVNSHLVHERFGRWPDFHDGEVHRVLMDRTRCHPGGGFYPSIELVIRGWNMTSEVTEAGFYKLEDDSLVHFLFEEVSEVRFDGLNHQNVVSELIIELEAAEGDAGPLISVELSHCYGLWGAFNAKRATVLSVTPFTQ